MKKTVEPDLKPKPYFSVPERFEFITQFVDLIAKKKVNSFILTGSGGLGKTHTVVETLKKRGLKEDSATEVGDFVTIRGYSTAKALYRTLWENNNKVILFDDADSVHKDPIGANILKAALGSEPKRIITWGAEFSKDDELPNRFEFKGRVVFISNLASHSLDQAIISRSLAVDLSMTPAQKIDRMRFLLDQPDFMPDYDKQHKVDAMDLIARLVDTVKELSLRTLIQVTKIRKSAGANWQDLAEYAICG